MNRVEVIALDRKFSRLEKPIGNLTKKLLKLSRVSNGQIEIYLVGDRFMNKNVLAFPSPKGFPRPDVEKGLKMLGEIYLNPDYIRREPLKIENLKLKIDAKLAYMLIHGFLHILGYDHKKKNDRIVMERKEADLLSALGS